MWSKIRLVIYGTTALAGIIWPFYFINQFINLVRNGNIQGSAIDIGNAFFDDAWITLHQDLYPLIQRFFS